MAAEIVKHEEDDAFSGKPYTRKEAEEASFAFVRSGVEVRHRLLDLFERQAHKALGYASFEEYAEQRLGLDMDPVRMRRMRMWARVERDVLVDNGSNKTFPMGNILDAVALTPLTKHLAEKLSELPSSERRAAYQELLDLGVNQKSLLSQAKHVVTRRLKPAVTPTALTPATPPPPVAAPVTAPMAAAPKQTSKPAPAPQKAAGGQSGASSAPAPAAPPTKTGPLQKVHPHEDWIEALEDATAWVHNGECDGTKAQKKSVSALLVKVGCWIAEA